LITVMPVLLAPVIGWAWGNSRTIFVAPLIAGLLLLGLYPSMDSLRRPIRGPRSVFKVDYEASRFFLGAAFAKGSQPLMEKLNTLRPGTLAIGSSNSSQDYMAQRMILDRVSPAPRFCVFNPSKKIPGVEDPAPDAVLAEGGAPFVVHAATKTRYLLSASAGRYSLYVPLQMKAASPAK
jgi:hypothetical protein